MTFRFIHTADWQIGKPFARFAPGLAGELAAARLDAISRIAAIARSRSAGHVVVAGDVFDSEALSNADLRRALERLNSERDLTWLLLPGNHDPARVGGVWDRIAKLGLPANVTALFVPQPVMLARDAMLLPAPLTSKNPGVDPSAWMDDAPSTEGVARIGLAHGSVQGFGSLGESAVAIARDRAQRARLSYLALGDWHGMKSVALDTWYSGTPEPDGFQDNDPGHVLCVTLEGRALAGVEPVPSGAFTWIRVQQRVSGAADFAEIERALAARGVALRNVLARLDVSGSLTLADYAAFAEWQEAWSAKLRQLEADTSALVIRPATEDFARFTASPALAAAARRLNQLASDPANADRSVAEAALVRLYGFAAEAERETAP